ncbi:MAG: glycosyltransferase family 9 protein [Ignavibacteria bacterium]
MIELPVIHYDCIHFYGDRPCKPNKENGVFCGNCSYYEKDLQITEAFPAIPDADNVNDSEGGKKIIIVKLDAVGDVLRTTSILPTLREKFTDCSITWITKERSYEVLKDNEMINEIYFDTPEELEHFKDNLYDIAINLDSGSDSCEIMNKVKAKARFGYCLANGKPYPINSLANEWYLMGVNDNFKKENKKSYHEIIHEICGLRYEGSEPAIYPTTVKRKRIEELRKSFRLENFESIILINLGGGNRWQYKKWTREGYTELVSILSAKYPRRAVGIIAGDEDRDFYTDISGDLEKLSRENIIFFGTENSMEDFICIVSLASEVFTSDSLCFHIATSLGKHTVVIVGPTSHTELDVFGMGKIIYSDKVDCLCCYLNKCDKTITCMNTIKTEDISGLFTAAN